MPVISRYQKLALGVGALGGAMLFCYNVCGNRDPIQVYNSWTTNFTPSVKWDHNWDKWVVVSFFRLSSSSLLRGETTRFGRSIVSISSDFHNGRVKLTWDCIYRRDPKSLVKPLRIDENMYDIENKYNDKVEAKKAKAVRHVLLIRHGQYHMEGKMDAERTLTELGEWVSDSADFSYN